MQLEHNTHLCTLDYIYLFIYLFIYFFIYSFIYLSRNSQTYFRLFVFLQMVVFMCFITYFETYINN